MIELTQGRVALVDDTDYEWLSQFSWCTRASSGGLLGTMYAERRRQVREYTLSKRSGCVQMHRALLQPPDDLDVDHINGDGLDNRRCNLRIVSTTENISRKRKTSATTYSIYKGVSHSKSKKNPWCAYICPRGKYIHLGLFKTEEDAAIAYNDAAIKYFGEFARLNDIPQLVA